MTTFLLFLAAIIALLTYIIVPRVPVATLMSVAAVGLAIGVWWHWTQFAVDYRTSTWQEQLRYYASYVLVLAVILLSYAFYVFALSGSSLKDYAASTASTVRNSGRRALSRVTQATSAIYSAEPSELPEPIGIPESVESEPTASETAAANFFQ